MALKTINESPTVADTIKFTLLTPGADGVLANPYKVDHITIYFISRGFTSSNFFEYDLKKYDEAKLQAAITAEQVADADPTVEHIMAARVARLNAESSAVTNKFYYNEATPVKKFGSELYPAWLSTDTPNAFITNTSTGTFELQWEPAGQREGQYFICWTWTPLAGSNTMTAHDYFEIFSYNKIATSPRHLTADSKYETLLTKYTPEMFKTIVSLRDKTPDVLDKFNKSVAKGFKVMEDFAVQLIDLLDANMASESCLGLLGNMFNVKLKTNDPTLWRRQVKRAIPLFKRKGTRRGLEEAYANAGIAVTKLTQLWQIISSYTWVEAFNVERSDEFILGKDPVLSSGLQPDPLNFELSLRPEGEDEFVDIANPMDYVEFEVTDRYTLMRWIGTTASPPVALAPGDTLKVIYPVKTVPSEEQQDIENYIRTLPLNDQRDDRAQQYPLKNWNVRLIEEDDPMIDVVIPSRHPYENAVVFGQVRTQFPFSENIYNMEQYNGSLRDSTDPCDIDKDFLDCCTACLSSKFNIDLELEKLSDEKLIEAEQILDEFKPFHAVLHSMNISGMVEEFINCNTEEVEALVSYNQEESIFAGSVQTIFNRVMENSYVPGYDSAAVRRSIREDALQDLELCTPAGTPPEGTASSREIVLYAPYINFHHLMSINNAVYMNDPDSYVAGSNNNRLEILPPSWLHNTSIKTYVVSGKIGAHVLHLDQSPDTIPEPLLNRQFTFRLSNIVYSNATNDIIPDNLYNISDEKVKLASFAIQDNWKVEIDGTQYDILDLMPDGSLYISGGTEAANVTYSLLNGDGEVVYPNRLTEEGFGTVTVTERAIVDVTDLDIEDIRNFVKIGDYVVFGGEQYQVLGFVEGEGKQFYISYTGAGAGTSIQVYRRVADNQIGFLGYRGLRLVATGSYEDDLQIQNGRTNTPEGGFVGYGEGLDNDHFKENYLVRIDDEEGAHYFTITDIADGEGTTEFILNGEAQTWPTTGTTVHFSIYRGTKRAFTVPEQIQPPDPGYAFEAPVGGGPPTSGVDRRGKDIITFSIRQNDSMDMRAKALNAVNKSQMLDVINQQESISLNIEWADGSTEEKKL